MALKTPTPLPLPNPSYPLPPFTKTQTPKTPPHKILHNSSHNSTPLSSIQVRPPVMIFHEWSFPRGSRQRECLAWRIDQLTSFLRTSPHHTHLHLRYRSLLVYMGGGLRGKQQEGRGLGGREARDVNVYNRMVGGDKRWISISPISLTYNLLAIPPHLPNLTYSTLNLNPVQSRHNSNGNASHKRIRLTTPCHTLYLYGTFPLTTFPTCTQSTSNRTLHSQIGHQENGFSSPL